LRWGFAELRLVGRERDVEHDMAIPLTGVPLAERGFFMHTTGGVAIADQFRQTAALGSPLRHRRNPVEGS